MHIVYNYMYMYMYLGATWMLRNVNIIIYIIILYTCFNGR